MPITFHRSMLTGKLNHTLVQGAPPGDGWFPCGPVELEIALRQGIELTDEEKQTVRLNWTSPINARQAELLIAAEMQRASDLLAKEDTPEQIRKAVAKYGSKKRALFAALALHSSAVQAIINRISD